MSVNKQKIWLAVGVGAIATALGFMVGASSTPVVGVALPAIFGLVITAFGLFSNTSVEKKLDGLMKVDKLTEAQEILSNIQIELKHLPEFMGKLLIVFSLLYLTGLSIGAKARINKWFAPSPPPPKQIQLPWAKANEPPPTGVAAVEWIALQQQLFRLGYTQEQVEHLYSIQVNEWKKRNETKKNDEDVSIDSGPDITRVLERLLEEKKTGNEESEVKALQGDEFSTPKH